MKLKHPSSYLYLFPFFIICCQSCFKEPTAAFSYKPNPNPEAGEHIEFINESLDAEYFYWDFGNGKTSDEMSPTTVYDEPGDYKVCLVSETNYRADSTEELITIRPPTIMEIYLYDARGNPIEFSWVKVYKSVGDAEVDFNIQGNERTSWSGYVKFQNLEPISYFVYFEKFIQEGVYRSGGYIGPLRQNKINTFVAVADFYPDGKKSAIKPLNINSVD